jgi:hypothetical protein
MNRRGSALLVALVVLVGLAMLGMATLELADRSMEAARREEARVRIQAAGRSALARALARLSPDSVVGLAPGQGRQLDSVIPLPGAVAVDSIMSLSPSLLEASGTAWVSRAGGAIEARDATRELIQLIELQVAETAAVVTTGPLRIEGAGQVAGTDLPAGSLPLCLPAAGTGPAALVASAAGLWVDSSSGAGITGTPALALDSTISAGFLNRLRPSSLQVLASASAHPLLALAGAPGPSALGAGCDTTDPLNWGDPTASSSACAGYRPIIQLAPGAMVTGGVGQGVLVGTGALHLGGSFRFEGVVLARGPVVVDDSAVVTGVLLGGDSVTVRGHAAVIRSSCAVRAARDAARRLRRLQSRSWSWGP